MKELSLQLYSIKNYLKENGFDKTFETVSKMGYTGVEFYTFGEHSKEEMKALLKKHNLKAVSAHAGDVTERPEFYIDYMSYLGAKYICCPYANGDTKDVWLEKAKKLNEAGQQAEKSGMKLSYHNHAHEFSMDFNGENPWDILLNNAEHLYAQPDTYHVISGGYDVYDVLEKYKDKIYTVHFKEITADKGEAAAGDGIIDFARCLNILNDGTEIIYEYEGENEIEDCAKAAKYLLSL